MLSIIRHISVLLNLDLPLLAQYCTLSRYCTKVRRILLDLPFAGQNVVAQALDHIPVSDALRANTVHRFLSKLEVRKILVPYLKAWKQRLPKYTRDCRKNNIMAGK